MNKEEIERVKELLNKCDKCKLKECIACEFTYTDIQKIKRYVKNLETTNETLDKECSRLEQNDFILDKVTDKLKEDIKRFDKIILDKRVWGEQKVDFKKYKEYAISLLNIIEGEKK